MSSHCLSVFLTDTIIKNIKNEIVRECAQRHLFIDHNVASLLVGLLLSFKDSDENLSFKISEKILDREKFIRKCVQNFQDNTPTIRTLKMQTYYLLNPLKMERIKEKYSIIKNPKLNVLLEEIPNSKDEQDRFLEKIAIDSILYNMLGDPADKKVLTETINALRSVLSRSDLINFIKMNYQSRLESLENIRQVVCGIRIFNKNAGHFGEGIRDILDDLNVTYKKTKTSLNDSIGTVSKRIILLTDIFENYIQIDSKNDQVLLQFPTNVKKEDFAFLKGIMIMITQREQYLKELRNYLMKLRKTIDGKTEIYQNILKNIHEILQFRRAIPTDKIFPHFIELAKIWKCLLDMFYMMIEINCLNDQMNKFTSDIEIDQVIDEFLDEDGIISIKNSALGYANTTREEFESLKQEIGSSKCKFISQSHDLNLTTRPKNRFCAYTFAIGNGILMPADTNLNLLVEGGHIFAFSRIEYAEKFAKNCKIYTEKYMNVAKTIPEIIIFFEIYEEMKNFRFINHTEENFAKSIEKLHSSEVSDANVQTELHPIPYNKDPQYVWNIWDLRRKAIQLANIKKSSTNSAQTNISYYRMNKGLQTHLPKVQAVQTCKDASVNNTGTAKNSVTMTDGIQKLNVGSKSGVRTSNKAPFGSKDLYTASYILKKL